MEQTDLAGVVAFFQSTDDVELLKDVLRRIRPQAARAVSGFERTGREAPPPSDVPAEGQPATRAAALAWTREVRDFAQLQSVARAIGRRIEELQTG
ncbi:MAG: hypothetical protein GEU75_01640 [Dehalococcoidia bacterium]|nr:hypothetical protein [Dehalococcoidia bacterium]